jgi:hypothetical protein
VQRLYASENIKSGQSPIIEYQHRIVHQLDQLGNRQSSDLQNIGNTQWLLYGAGRMHGLMLGGQVHRSWQEQDFNLLGVGTPQTRQRGPITKWPDMPATARRLPTR